MYTGKVILELHDGAGGTISKSIEASAPTLYILEGVVRDIMFVRTAELLDHIFEEPEFEKPKAPKQAKKKPAPKTKGKNAKTAVPKGD